jgi:arylsulfatase A-like enzyme
VEEYARVVERLYKSRIRELDTMFGGVVEELRRADLLDASPVAFTADHGEVLYREDVPFKWTRGHALTPEDLGVPWIVRAGGLAPGRYPG